MQVVQCPNAPKLDPRVRRTRQLLEGAFRALIKERPYADISVGDIADLATVNRATFYSHYEDKDHLANSMLKGDLEAALVAKLQDCKEFSAENLTCIGAALFEFIAGFQMSCPKHAGDLENRIGPALREATHSFIRTWLDIDPKAMRFFNGASPDTVATVIAWSLYGGAMSWTRYSRRPAATVAVREIVALLLGPRPIR